MTETQATEQVVVVAQSSINPRQTVTRMALFESDGSPVSTLLAEVPDGGDVVLTGYTSTSAAAVAATDTVNAGIAKLEARTLAAPPVGSNVVLTGYVLGSSTAAVAATDTLNAAISKLEKRIAALEGA